ELTKYAANAFLATKIAFINEIADICEKVGANIEQVADGIGSDHRIGRNYLSPGPGFGGSCFPKDTLALRKIGRDFEAPTQVVDAVVKSNDNRKHAMAKKIIAANGGDVFCKNIALLGLAFKANTDDMRESPSLVIVPTLRKRGAHIRAFDPEAMEQAQKELGDEEITWCNDAYDALDGADCAVIATEWNEFRNLDLDEVKKRLKTPLLIDLRNLYPRHYVQKFGLKYVSIGRP
ncbi:MAG: UDP-glucose/GDP-mannose dehydrogenase family protein, partial [Rickettsiales bacterium]|nr:UDP-glucose/GDP-mannose dehydrogenase family protein [Rickettsiales bacterium]